MVPGGGFEPPTRGFSIRCSTPELPGQAKQGSGVLAPLIALVQRRNRFFADQLYRASTFSFSASAASATAFTLASKSLR